MRFRHPVRDTRLATTLRSRCVAGCAFAISIAGPSLTAAAPPVEEVVETRRVCTEGPAAALHRAERLRGEASVAATGVLPNPTLAVEHQRTLSGVGDHETIVGLSVPLGLGGRRFLLQDAAQARREQAIADAQATRFETALAFREAYVAAAIDEARLAALTRQQEALSTLTSTIERLARGGESAGYDLLRQRTHARVHARLVASMRARAAASRALLEAWTGKDVTLPPGDLAKLAGGPQPRAQGGLAELPRVRSLEAAARAHGLEAKAARRRWVPDIEISVGYRMLSGAAQETGHGISLGLTVPLTLFDHGQGEAAHADAEQAVAEAMAAGLKRESTARVKAAGARLDILEAHVAELDRAVTEAATLETQAGRLYAAGELSIAELLDALGAAEQARLARIDLAEEIALARLAWMAASGTLLDATLDSACGRGNP